MILLCHTCVRLDDVLLALRFNLGYVKHYSLTYLGTTLIKYDLAYS